MKDLEAAGLMCVILQKLDSGRENLNKLREHRKSLETKEIWFETRDCPVWTDIKDEPLQRYPDCPFSMAYINSSDFQKKFKAYNKKKRSGDLKYIHDLIYEDQIRYDEYLHERDKIEQQNNITGLRNEEKRKRREANTVNIPEQERRRQEAVRKRKEELSWYDSRIVIFESGVKAAEKMLELLYQQYRIDYEVRALPPMIQIYRYLWTGQCYTIGSATKEYFDRKWKNEVLGKLDEISGTMRQILTNQTSLQNSISELEKVNRQILNELKDINTMSSNMTGILADVNETLNSINTMKLGDAS